MMDLVLDENGLISDTDKRYEELDKWYDLDRADKEIELILSVPRKLWSKKFWFRLICAYNNNGDYEKSEEELAKIEPHCEKAVEKARFHYYRGWLRGEKTQNPVESLREYKKGLDADPDDTLDLTGRYEECEAELQDIMDNMRSAVVHTVDIIKRRCALVPDDKKVEVDDETFQLFLGFYQGVVSLGFDNYFAKCKDDDREKEMQLLNAYNITDRDSFFECIQNNQNMNQNVYLNDALAYMNGNPVFDIDELEGDGRLCFLTYIEFVKTFIDELPDAGVIAWDIGEKIGLNRYAYACGILGNSDYVTGMLTLSDLLKEKFSSFEEYARSLIFGAALLMFQISGMNVRKAKDFMCTVTKYFLDSRLPDTKWMK